MAAILLGKSIKLPPKTEEDEQNLRMQIIDFNFPVDLVFYCIFCGLNIIFHELICFMYLFYLVV